jgi:hypothetical protein
MKSDKRWENEDLILGVEHWEKDMKGPKLEPGEGPVPVTATIKRKKT